jgi:hypothetical protein
MIIARLSLYYIRLLLFHPIQTCSHSHFQFLYICYVRLVLCAIDFSISFIYSFHYSSLFLLAPKYCFIYFLLFIFSFLVLFKLIYSLRSILRFANTDISNTKMCLDSSILPKSNMGWRK